ncbi:MAG: hypothetical protein RLZZ585_885 [Bacteroidota bacterium]|jgi:hypothetical protein
MKILLSFIILLSAANLFAQQVELITGGVPEPMLVSIAPPDSLVNFPDTEAQYPGGPDSLAEFIFVNFILPDDTSEVLWDQRVYLSFIVEKDGSINNIVVEKGANELYDSICVAVVQQMPKWIPAQKDGLPVRSLMRLPINIDDAIIGPDDFELSDEEWSEEDDEDEGSKRKFGGGHYAGFDVYFSQFANDNGDVTFDQNPYWEINQMKSFGFNYNMFDLKFPIAGKELGITTGLGFGYHNYSFRNNYVLAHTADTIYAIQDTVFDFKTNKLQVGAVSIPLLLDYSFSKNFEKSYYMAVGVIGTYNYANKQTVTGTYANGDQFVNSTISAFNMNRWTLDATTRIGYGHFGMFISYQLNSMFKTGHTVAVYPFRIGFNILFGI